LTPTFLINGRNGQGQFLKCSVLGSSYSVQTELDPPPTRPRGVPQVSPRWPTNECQVTKSHCIDSVSIKQNEGHRKGETSRLKSTVTRVKFK